MSPKALDVSTTSACDVMETSMWLSSWTQQSPSAAVKKPKLRKGYNRGLTRDKKQRGSMQGQVLNPECVPPCLAQEPWKVQAPAKWKKTYLLTEQREKVQLITDAPISHQSQVHLFRGQFSPRRLYWASFRSRRGWEMRRGNNAAESELSWGGPQWVPEMRVYTWPFQTLPQRIPH